MKGDVMYYLLREISPIRLACNHSGCQVVTELPLQLVEPLMTKTGCCCPACGRPFTRPDVEGGADVVTALAKAMLAINKVFAQVRVELPLKREE